MRRKDREITDKSKILEIIGKCRCCRIALADGNSPYIVPLSFGYDSGRNAIYFHGAIKGRKVELIRRNGYAGFEMDTAHELVTAGNACGFSFRYQSIVGQGRISIVENMEEKRSGLDCIMKHMSGKDGWQYPDAMLWTTAVIRLDVEALSAKANE